MKRLALRLQSVFSKLGIVVLSKSSFAEMQESVKRARKYAILTHFHGGEERANFLALEQHSKSQLQQDLLAAASANFKTSGYFVEFGATNGETLSNSYLLEKILGWTGILAEPGREWHATLDANRSARIVKKAVWSQSDLELEFIESGELSTLSAFRAKDEHSRYGRSYKVKTISLMDLLRENEAPKFIDFLSVDTEGSELEILEAFDFSEFTFGLICVEHNFTPQEQAIERLLSANGYNRILEDFSQWDAWFVPSVDNQ